MAVEFVPIDRDTPYIFPPSVQDYLPEDHLARFVVEIVDQLDMSAPVWVYYPVRAPSLFIQPCW